MKRTIIALATVLIVFVAVFGVLVLRPVPKVRANHHGCSDATLFGNYGFVGSGWYGGAVVIVSGAPIVVGPPPASASALVNFDGKGGFSGSNFHVVLNGSEVTASPFTFSDETYTVNPDCTFSITFTGPPLSKGEAVLTGTVVDKEGGQIIGSLLSSGATATFEAKKVPGEEGEVPGPAR